MKSMKIEYQAKLDEADVQKAEENIVKYTKPVA